MFNKIISKELFVIAFVLITGKVTVFQASIGDAFVFLGLCGLYGYKLYLDRQREVTTITEISELETKINKLTQDLEQIKGSVSAVTLKNTAKPGLSQRMF